MTWGGLFMRILCNQIKAQVNITVCTHDMYF